MTTASLLSKRWIRLERRLAASPERVYRAWSDPAELRTWFADIVEGSLAVGARSVLVWPERRAAVEVLEAEPDDRFHFRWSLLPDDPYPFEVTVTIRPRGYGSVVLLEAGAWDPTLPGALDHFLVELERWVDALAALRAQLDFAVDLRPPR